MFIELGVSRPVEAGIGFGGAFAIIYLCSGAIFWAVSKFFNIPSVPESYWQAGMFTLIHLFACIFLTYCLEIIVFGAVVKEMGPIEYNQSRLSILAAVYLPTLFTGILAVSARARVKLNRANIGSSRQAFLFNHAITILPVFTVVLAIGFMLTQPSEIRSLIEARMFYEVDASERAIDLSSRGLELKEDFAPLHYLKGSAILDSAPASFTPAMALYHLQRAVSLVPDNALYLYKLSIAHDVEHNYDQAVEAASAAVSLQPNDAFLWQHLGELNLKYRNYVEAILAYKGALKLEPDSPSLLNNLAFTSLELNQDLPQALELAKRSVELLPGFIFNTDTLAWAYYKNGMNAEALEVMNTIYSDRSELTAEVDFHYAMILLANGMLAEPLKTLEKLLARPEVISDPSLLRQVSEAKMKLLLQPEANGKGKEKDNE